MKRAITTIISVFIFLSLFFTCRGKDNLSMTVNDDNGKLRIKVDADKNWKKIRYDTSFNIRGLSKVQRDSIVHHVFDSLHLGVNETK